MTAKQLPIDTTYRLPSLPQLSLRAETYNRIPTISTMLTLDNHPHFHNRKPNHSSGLPFLYELAAGFHSPSDTNGFCIEFGTYLGGSTCVMAEAIKDHNQQLPLFTININPHVNPYIPADPDHDKQLLIHQNSSIPPFLFHKLQLTDYICSIIYDDAKLLELWNLPLRFAFIDSDHSYDHTYNLLQKTFDNLVINGWILVHDYYEYGNNFPVIPATNAFIDQNTHHLQTYRAEEDSIAIKRTD